MARGAAQQSLLLLVLCWATAALKRCPRGSFLDAVGKLVPSPDGKYWETVNYRHTAHCKLCPAGKYSNSVQSQVCTECPGGNARGGLKRYTGWTGTYSSDGATQCHACPVGKWRIHSGKSFCWVQIDEVHKTHAPNTLKPWDPKTWELKKNTRAIKNKLLHTTSGKGPENPDFKPDHSAMCCVSKCGKLSNGRDPQGHLIEDARADCRLGCHTWVRFSSLNWEAGRWASKLRKKCETDCSMHVQYAKLYNTVTGKPFKRLSSNVTGDSQRYGDQAIRVHEGFCRQGCNYFMSCM